MRVQAAAVAGALLVGVVLWLLFGRSPPPKVSTQPQKPTAASEAAIAEPQTSTILIVEAPLPSAASRLQQGGSPYASEDDYLRALEQLNATDKPRALELVQKGEHWYRSSGVRAEARKAMGITLLVDLGEMEEARARTRRFIELHPESRYRPLVQGVTGIHPRPTVRSKPE